MFVNSEADRALTSNTNVVVDGVCDRLVLTDGHSFGVEREFNAKEAVYSRDMKAGEVTSLYLPFKAEDPVFAVDNGMLAETSKLEPFRGYFLSDFETAIKQITDLKRCFSRAECIFVEEEGRDMGFFC